MRFEVERARVRQGDGGVESLTGEQQAEGAPHGETAADHYNTLAGNGDVVTLQHLDDAGGGAGKRGVQRAAHAEHQATEVGRVEAVGVLGGVHQLEHGVLVESGGQWKLNDVAGDGGVLVEPHNGGAYLVGGRGLRKVNTDRLDTDLGAVAVFARHIGEGAGVAAHQQGAKAGRDATGLESGDAFGQFVFHGGRSGDAVELYCSHSDSPSQ